MKLFGVASSFVLILSMNSFAADWEKTIVCGAKIEMQKRESDFSVSLKEEKSEPKYFNLVPRNKFVNDKVLTTSGSFNFKNGHSVSFTYDFEPAGKGYLAEVGEIEGDPIMSLTSTFMRHESGDSIKVLAIGTKYDSGRGIRLSPNSGDDTRDMVDLDNYLRNTEVATKLVNAGLDPLDVFYGTTRAVIDESDVVAAYSYCRIYRQ